MPVSHVGNRDIKKRALLKWSPPDTSVGTWRTITLSNTATGRQTRDPLNASPLDSSNSNNAPFMDPQINYIVKQSETISVTGGIEINGGANVIAKGLHVNFPSDYGTTNSNRAMFIKGNQFRTQPRTLHIEGLRAEGYLTEGINVDSQSFINSNQVVGDPGLTVQIQNTEFVDIIHGTQATNHADIFQGYNGPYQLRMHRVYGLTQYQGLMIQPHQFGFSPLGTYEFKDCYFEGTSDSGVILYMVAGDGDDRPTVVTTNVWVKHNPTKSFPSQVMLEDPNFWGSGVKVAPNGRRSFVTSCPGLAYVSPGYEVP